MSLLGLCATRPSFLMVKNFRPTYQLKIISHFEPYRMKHKSFEQVEKHLLLLADEKYETKSCLS